MFCINVQTKNILVIEAIKAIVSLDSDTTYDEKHYSLSQSDQEKLKQIVKKSDNNELKFLSLDEAKEATKEYLIRLGAKI